MISHSLISAHDFTAVRAALVRALDGDGNAALVLTRIHWRTEQLPPGAWWRCNLQQISDETGLTMMQVRGAIRRLRESGHLETQAEGWDRTYSYRIAWSDSSGSSQEADRPLGSAVSVDTPESSQEAKRPHPRGQTAPSMRPNGPLHEADRPLVPLLLDIEQDVRQELRQDHDQTVAAAFAEFWSVYPRRAGKADALRKYEIAVRRVNPRTILDAASRYRDDPNRKPEFTKHPATWLNQGCWDDDPLPAPTPELGTTDRRVMSYLESAVEHRANGGQVPLSARELAEQWKQNGHSTHTELERGHP